MKAARYFLALGGLAAAFVVDDAACGTGLIQSAVRAAEEAPAEILAAQIREQGYRCDGPLAAERDRERSKPDEAVWILKCANASYRIRLVPDMAAHVERLFP
jgi:hypothetical protein